jgi:tetratricopeptide (TPR) repeat protein
MEAGSLNDALGLLEKSLKMNKTVLGEDDISNASIYSTLSKVYLKKKDYDKALNQLSKVWELTETKFGKDSIEIAQVYLDTAKVYYKKKEYDEAITQQLHAINNFRTREEEYNQESTAKMMITLSEWYSKIENLDEAISWLRETEKLYEYIYGAVDKKTTKIKRDIALLLLKANKYDEALNEVIQVEEHERSLYGETSLQLGRTYKLIGTLYILRRMQNEAKAYLQKAQTIFELKGATKLLKEVKTKLNMAKTSLKMEHELAAEEEDNEHSDDDMSEEADMEESAKKVTVVKKKKKAASKQKKKKSAVRNNFMGN